MKEVFRRETKGNFFHRINKLINLQGASEDPRNLRLLPACVRPCSSKVKVNLCLTTHWAVWLFLTLPVLLRP